jgi:hypothetical protein
VYNACTVTTTTTPTPILGALDPNDGKPSFGSFYYVIICKIKYRLNIDYIDYYIIIILLLLSKTIIRFFLIRNISFLWIPVSFLWIPVSFLWIHVPFHRIPAGIIGAVRSTAQEMDGISWAFISIFCHGSYTEMSNCKGN